MMISPYYLVVLVNIPHRTPFFLPWLYPALTWRMPSTTNELFLTFDDGPVPGPTEFVLDTLQQFSAKATFFCIGDNVQKHPEVFKKILDAGHAVGNHTFHHLNGWKSNTRQYVDNVEQCARIMNRDGAANQHHSTLFRPPYGRISRKQILALHKFRIVMWDVLSVDYNKNLSPEACLNNTTKATRRGSIVVFHDSLKAEKNLVFALPRYLDYFSSRGFSFKAIT